MEQRVFGSMQRSVAVVGQGTWKFDKDESSAAINAMRSGLTAGMTHIDTAELYGSGKAEGMIAEALGDKRSEAFLVSKVHPKNASRKGTVAACEKSLQRLRTDHLDCYLLHWRGKYPLEDTVAAFEELHGQGKILSWGVSNFDVSDLQEVLQLRSKTRPVCNQVLYHLGERAIEHTLIPWCEAQRIAVVAYSPFGQGRFPEATSKGGTVLQEVAQRNGATAYQVALRFLLRFQSVFTIPKTGQAAHAADNAAAGELHLSDADIQQIDAAFPLGPPKRRLPMF